MHPLDAAILLGFVAWAVFSGLRARRLASRGLEDYFLAGRTLRGWQAGVSMAATQFAADTPLLVTGLIATAGIFSLWRLWVYAIAFLLLAFVLAPVWRRARVITDAELCEVRYERGPVLLLRGIKALYFGTVFNCVVLAMVLFAALAITEPLLLWADWLPAGLFDAARAVVAFVGVPLVHAGAPDPTWARSTSGALSILAIVSVTLAYSATGGLRSVVRTDLLQFAVMMLGTLCYAVVLVGELGGLSEIAVRLGDGFRGPGGITGSQILAFGPGQARDAGAAVLAVFALQWLVQMNADGTGYLAQRAMACRSDRDARIAGIVMTVLQILLRSLLWLPIGLALLLLFPAPAELSGAALQAEREVTFVRGIVAYLPPGVSGLMWTAMLAALASTLDTHLNWGASYWTRDLYQRIWMEGWRGRSPSQRSLVWVARAANGLVLMLALAILPALGSIQTAWTLSLMLGSGMGVMLVLRWIWWRVNAWGELAAIVASTALAPILLWTVDGEAMRLLLLAAGATTAGLVASLCTAPDSPAHLQRFHDQVRPPGFWGPQSVGGQSRRRLARGLAATAAGSASVFALLVGIGTWLVHAPAPPGWSRGAFVGPLIVLGLGLAVLAWRLGAASDGAAVSDEPALRDPPPAS